QRRAASICRPTCSPRGSIFARDRFRAIRTERSIGTRLRPSSRICSPQSDHVMAHSHAAMDGWTVVDDALVVGGVALTRLAQRVGRTPFYAYERRLIEQRVADLRAHLPANVKLHYAMKANPMPAVVGLFTRLVDGIDVASGGELTVALDAGADPDGISFAGPGKSDTELAQAVAAGILINVESAREVDVLTRV